MSLRLVAVLAGLALGVVVLGWGVATASRPALWTRPVGRWWVGWTSEPVARVHGAGVALVGTGLALSAAAGLFLVPAAPVTPTAHVMQLAGLGAVLLGGAVLLTTQPTPGHLETDHFAVAPPLPDPALLTVGTITADAIPDTPPSTLAAAP